MKDRFRHLSTKRLTHLAQLYVSVAVLIIIGLAIAEAVQYAPAQHSAPSPEEQKPWVMELP